MFGPFEVILVLCAITGCIMVIASILLLYLGAIRLSEKGVGSALQAKYKNLLHIQVRNPALGLFAIGLAFFALALYFAKPEERGTLVLVGILKFQTQIIFL